MSEGKMTIPTSQHSILVSSGTLAMELVVLLLRCGAAQTVAAPRPPAAAPPREGRACGLAQPSLAGRVLATPAWCGARGHGAAAWGQVADGPTRGNLLDLTLSCVCGTIDIQHFWCHMGADVRCMCQQHAWHLMHQPK